MEKKANLKITELFMAKAGKNGWDRCFHGTIRRDIDVIGHPAVYGNIKVLNGFILAQAKDQWELGERLDEICKMVLDEGLHASAGETVDIAGTPFFLN